VPVVILMLLVRRQPAVGGVVLIILGVLTATYVQGIMPTAAQLVAALLMGGPCILSGILLLVAAAIARPTPQPQQ
jgi:hypothetical protein